MVQSLARFVPDHVRANSLFDRRDPAAYEHVPKDTLSSRIQTLIGVTGVRLARFRAGWRELMLCPLQLIWRPHLLSIMIYEVGFCS